MTAPAPHPPERSAQRRLAGPLSSYLPLLLVIPLLIITILLPMVELPLNRWLVAAFLVTELVLLLMFLVRLRTVPRPYRAGWLQVFLSATFVAATATHWVFVPLSGGFGTAELLYLFAVALIWSATLRLQAPSSTRGGSRLWLIDVLVFTISGATLSWYFLISPDFMDQSTIATQFSRFMPLMDVSLLALTGWLLLRPGIAYPRPIFAVAILLSVLSNTSLHLVLEGELPFNTIGPLLWILATALLVTEARMPTPRPERRTIPRTGGDRTWASLLPYAAVALVVIVLVSEGTQGTGSRAFAILNTFTLVLFGLLILRQVLTLAENRKLTDSLLRANAELNHLAYHDALTGLPNRAAFERRAREAFDNGTLMGVMFLDLDGFKSVNDQLGHDAGDDLLRQMARRLVRVVPAGAQVSRLGGDEFLILFDGVQMTGDVAEQIRAAVEQPYSVAGQLRKVTLSIGMSDGEARPDILRHQADLAMYREKKRATADSP